MVSNKTKMMVSVLSFFFIVGFIIVLISFPQDFTARVVTSITTSYSENESLKGDISLSLKEGELIPKDAIISINIGGEVLDYTLSELVLEEAIEGDFYAEDLELEGSGEGYGVIGTGEVPVDVAFTMAISESSGIEVDVTDTSEEETEDTTEPTEEVVEEEDTSEEEVTTEETTEEESGEGETTTEEELEAEEESTEEEISEEPEVVVVEETSEEEPAEEVTTEETSEEETVDDTEETSEEPGTSPITGGVIAEVSNQISGTTSKGDPYTYNLGSGETASIVSSEQEVDLSISGSVVTVTTDYVEFEEGFGENFLGEEIAYTLEINLTALDIEAEEGALIVSLVYSNTEIATVSTTLSVESPDQTVTNATVSGVTFVSENLNDYSLSDSEQFALQASTGSTSAEITAAQVVDERLTVRFVIGKYWSENSYDYSGDTEEVRLLIELDRARFVKRLANSLLESEVDISNVEDLIGATNLAESDEVEEETAGEETTDEEVEIEEAEEEIIEEITSEEEPEEPEEETTEVVEEEV